MRINVKESWKAKGITHLQSPKAPPVSLGDGPGAELMALFADLSVMPPPGCDCEAYAVQMNSWGVSGCRERLNEIVGHLTDSKARWTWAEQAWNSIKAGVNAAWNGLPMSLEGIVEEAIRRAEVKEGEKKKLNHHVAAANEIVISFRHGIGDACNFAHMIPLYTRRGFMVRVHPGHADHAPVFRAAGAEIIGDAAMKHYWPEASRMSGPAWTINKNGWNVSKHPLPFIGTAESLWDDYRSVRLDFQPQVTEGNRGVVDLLLDRVASPIIVMHVAGYAKSYRDYSPDMTRELQRRLLSSTDGTIVMLDRTDSTRAPHLDCARVCYFESYGIGELYEVLRRADLLIGIDSGPLNCVRLTDTPAIGIWNAHYPSNFILPREKTLNVVAAHHEARAASEPSYWNVLVAPDDGPSPGFMAETALRVLEENSPKPMTDRAIATGTLRSRSFTRDYYEEHRRAGLDYLNFGNWQQEYGRWIVESLDWVGKPILDVGCACGSIVRGLGEAGAIVQGIDVNEHAIRLGRGKWPDMKPIIHTCDAANLHLYHDWQFDGLHSAQVAEHWPERLVSIILRELARVTKPGGLFFCALDTEELFARQGRKIENEDPTHVTIKPLAWWRNRLAASGWENCVDEYADRLREHAESFLSRYDWDWWIARRK